MTLYAENTKVPGGAIAGGNQPLKPAQSKQQDRRGYGAPGACRFVA